MSSSSVILHWTARSVDRQLQQRNELGQLLLPIRQLLAQYCAIDLFSLPDGVVGILNGQIGQPCRFSTGKFFVECSDLSKEYFSRPGIRRDVVHCEEQNILLLLNPDQNSPDH